VDVLPIDESDPLDNFRLIENELKLYSEEIWARPRLVALNKIDMMPSEDFDALRKRFEQLELPLYPISAATGQGTEDLIRGMYDALKETEAKEPEIVLFPALNVKSDQAWDVEEADSGFKVTGARILRMVEMTDLNNQEALSYLHRRLERIGVINRLRDMGAKEGDLVAVGHVELTFSDES
jgi:GTP-binding protein